jgi:5-methylcytosine-specific restriction enzyme subunit McrC
MILFDGIQGKEQIEDINGLESYITEVWQNRPLFLSEDDNEEERRSTKQRFFIIDGDTLKPRNYIGFVQYGDIRINIYPRVFLNHPAINVTSNGSLAINHVLKWLSYSTRFHFPFTEVPLQHQQQNDWLEALIFLFANYTLESLNNSPHFAYEEITEEMAFIRGKIAMQPYIQHNLSKGRHHLVHCTYEPFLYDNQFNRIVKYTCKMLLQTSNVQANRDLLQNILFLLDEVADVYCTAADCSKVKVNRLYPENGTITNMCAAFLSNHAYTDGSSQNQNLSILLPMEIIYEQYIAGFIVKHFPNLKAKPQASGEYVALTGEKLDQPVFRMKHDILLPGKMIIDTKYKFRYSNDDLKGGVSQQDVYQLITYCYKRSIKKGILLYPYHFDVNAKNEQHDFKIETAGDKMNLTACSINITESDLQRFQEGQYEKFNSLLLKLLL